jgi:RHS repeat-associated protein
MLRKPLILSLCFFHILTQSSFAVSFASIQPTPPPIIVSGGSPMVAPSAFGETPLPGTISRFSDSNFDVFEEALIADNDTNDIVTNMTYETMFNQVKTITDPKGNVTTFTYDHELAPADPKYAEKGNVIFIDFPTVAAGVPTTEFTYNAFGQVTEVKDPNGNITQYSYSPTTGYLQFMTQDPVGINAVTQFTYDAFGYLDTLTDAENRTTDYDYDALGWLSQVTNPLGYATKTFYDANGNVERIEWQASDPAGTWQITSFTYDILNNLKTVSDPLNRVTTYNYDASENLSSIVDAETNTTAYVYDERNKLFTVTDANTSAGITRYDYDLNGNLVKITDAEGNATNYAYDLFDRLDITIYADLSAVNHDYDKNSNLIKLTTPSTAVIDYVYDELNRLTNKQFPANTTLNAAYQYDLGSRMRFADIDGTGAPKIEFTYDTLNRLDAVIQTLNGNAYTVDYAFDKVGNKTQVVYPSTKNVEYTYDGLNRMDLVKLGGSNLVDYDFDPLDRRETKSFINTNLPKATYSFDIANQLTNLVNEILPSTAVSTYAYPLYDAVGNRKQMDRTFNSTTSNIEYFYNDIYELTSVTGGQSNSYAYDNVGNRTTVDSVSYTPNNLNQYTAIGSNTLTYDDNGNLTFDGVDKNFTYDELNRLVSFDTTGTADDATYEYDAFNRRVSKTVNGVTTYFVYDADSVIAEYDHAVSTTAPEAEYVLGDSIDEVLTMERNSTMYYYHYDGLGSVAEITDSSGNLVESYAYDSYGNITSALSTIGNPYYFTGRRFDEESGIYYYRARQYDPTIGRFLQRDPLAYHESMNLYQYTLNNPINRIDPDGRDSYVLTQFGHELFVVDDPLNPGHTVVFDFFPAEKTLQSLITPVPGKVREQYFGPGERPPFAVEIPLTRVVSDSATDAKLIERARLLKEAAESGDLKYRALLSDINCIGFTNAIR